MRPVLVTQRVEIVPDYGERRDALDQQWTALLSDCGLLAVPVPNDSTAALALAEAVDPAGLILTGGNDLADYGGNAQERDTAEIALVGWCRARRLPVLGICRGLQLLAHLFGAELARIDGHAGARHRVSGPKGQRDVNSFHNWGPSALPEGELVIDYVSSDGVIEGFHHRSEAVRAVMWHPERETPPKEDDLRLIREMFRGAADGATR